MSHYQQLIEEEIRSVTGQRAHCLEVIAAGGLQAWQAKEYTSLVEQYDAKLVELNGRLSQGTSLTLETAVMAISKVQAAYNCTDLEAITKMQEAAARAGDERSLDVLCSIKSELLGLSSVVTH